MFFKDHFGMVVGTIIALVMGLIMSIASLIVDSLPMNFSMFFKNWGSITLVVLLVSIVIPCSVLGEKFAAALKCKPGSIAGILIANIIPSLIINTFNTLIVSAVNIFYNNAIPAELQFSAWMAAVVHDWPIMFVVSYIAALIAQKIGVAVAIKNVSGNK